MLAHLLSRVAAELPGTRLRGLELAPAYVRAYVAENVFDMAVVPGGIQNRPAAWTNERAAMLRIVLLARPEFASKLGPIPLTVDRVRRLPFIGPARTGGDRFVAISDDCPLSPDERWIAHEAQSIGVALEFVRRTDNVVSVRALRRGDCSKPVPSSSLPSPAGACAIRCTSSAMATAFLRRCARR